MNVAIRVDASRIIGSGHIMRCLALGDGLREKGVSVHFVCRAHEGNLIGFIRDRQYDCSALDGSRDVGEDTGAAERAQLPEHTSWLGMSWERDAEETAEVLGKIPCDWLVVDHYALDQRWESALRSVAGRIMVIDDLADRRHDCDVLLDSVCGRKPMHYQGLVPNTCRFLLGSDYVLLRPEFAEWRPVALQRRKEGRLVQRFFVTLGGVDSANLTGVVLEQLAKADLPTSSEIDVVLGAGFARGNEIKTQAEDMPVRTSVSVAVDNMAERMTYADLAICGGGVGALECCCMGLPAITVVVGKNQQVNVQALGGKGISGFISAESVASEFLPALLCATDDRARYQRTVSCGSQLVDGRGVLRAAQFLVSREGVLSG